MPLQEVSAGCDRPLQELADVIFNSHKVVVITGAGISTSCGIPDFRSKDGLYNLVPEQNILPTPPPSNPSTPSRKRKASENDLDTPSRKRLALADDDTDTPPSSQSSSTSSSSRRGSAPPARLKGQDLFDSRVWQNTYTTSVFYQFIASLRQKIHTEVAEPSATHRFIRTLRDGGRLMRCYTQNIDGLESRAGLCMNLSRGKGNKRRFMKKNFQAPLPEQTVDTDFDGGCEVVPLHGDLDKLRCTLCQSTYEWSDDDTERFLEGEAPQCERCGQKSNEREANGKRGLSVGSLRPNIVLYGEEHPLNTTLTPLLSFDVASGPEVLIVMGTSLKVFGLQKIVRDFAKAVHAQKEGKGRVIFVNRTRPAESVWDGIIDDYVSMDCDDWVQDLHERRSDLWLRQGDLKLKVTKPSIKRKRKHSDAGEDESRPTKKAKIVVEISLANREKPKPRKPKKLVIATDQSSNSQPSMDAIPPGVQVPRTPRKSYQFLKSAYLHHPNQPLLSALAKARRPDVSPLGCSIKPFQLGANETIFGTPKRPPISPITPRVNTPARRMKEIFRQVTEPRQGAKTSESDHTEKENIRNPTEDTSGGDIEGVNWGTPSRFSRKEARNSGLHGPLFRTQPQVLPNKLPNASLLDRLKASIGF